MSHLTQAWPRPTRVRPIVVIGAGAIVRSAHLPAYARLGYPVAGIYDIDSERAREAAATVPGAVPFATLEAATRDPGATTILGPI